MNRARARSSVLVGVMTIIVAGVFSTASGGGGDDEWQAPARAARKKNPLPPGDAFSIEVGKEIFTKQCATCHGSSGHGDGPSAADLDRRPADLTSARVAAQTDGAIFWKIGEGHKPMPTFDVIVSEDGRWHVVTYLRTLMPHPAATRPATSPSSRPGGQASSSH